MGWLNQLAGIEEKLLESEGEYTSRWRRALVGMAAEASRLKGGIFAKRRARLEREGWAAVVRVWPRLDPDTRSHAVQVGRGQLEAAAEAIGREHDTAVALIAAQTCGVKLARRTGLMLMDPRRDLRAIAAGAVRAMAERAESMAASDQAELREVVAELAATWEHHRCESVLDAAILLLVPGVRGSGGRSCRLREWFRRGDDPAHGAMRSLMKRLDGAPARVRAWEWLGGDEAGAAAAERLSWAKSIPEHDAVLERGYLVESPARRRRVGMIAIREGRRGLLPRPEEVESLSVEARRGLVRVLPAARMSEGMSAELWSKLGEDGDAGVRHLVASLGPGPVATRLASDGDGRVAGTAGLRVGPAPEHERAGWARLLCDDPSAAIGDLRRRISSVETAVDGVAMARRHGLESAVELELMRAATGHRAEEVVASAVAALGRVPTASAMAVVKACTMHPVPRVRANAVEVLARQGPLEADQVRAATSEQEHHRVRANGAMAAVRWTGASTSTALVASMLHDERAAHRVAGLWVVARVVRGARVMDAEAARLWSPRVAHLAASDPEEAVRARAAWCGERMMAGLRAGWASRAAAV